MVDRTPREQATREVDQRNKGWQRPTLLPTPNPKDGLKFRWVRTSTLGQGDNKNVSSRFREGYVPVLAKDYPELKVVADFDSRWPENIEVGGLILCAIPTEIAQQRSEYQDHMAASQMDAVDRSYLRESDARMPVLKPERHTKTSFGRG